MFTDNNFVCQTLFENILTQAQKIRIKFKTIRNMVGFNLFF